MSWFQSKIKEDSSPIEGVDSVVEGLKNIYHQKIEPVEKLYNYANFHSPIMHDGDFDAKPTVLFLGQYSTGKCLARDTPVLLHSGRTVAVQNVCVGDAVMGDDGSPRTVVDVVRGRELMARVSAAGGAAFECNVSHVLSVKLRTEKRVVATRKSDGSIGSLRVAAAGLAAGEEVIARGATVDVSVKDLLDETVVAQELRAAMYAYGAGQVQFAARKRVPLDAFALGRWLAGGGVASDDVELRRYVETLESRERVPEAFKCGSVATRRHLLAGFESVSRELSADMRFVALSLGRGGERATPLRVELLSEGEYFGFQLSGANHRFVLGESFTVTHNTSFIEYLLEHKAPGMAIGPEPTTDKFVAIYGSDKECTVPGQALAVQADKPYRGLDKFGSAFLNRFLGSQCNAPLLDMFTFIDTPGVLSGEKQRIARGYEYTKVIEWFSTRADMILLLFDAHKLDVSDEFKEAIQALKGNEDKVRIVLNKADRVTGQQLMRVYGALMWSLGKVFNTPEVSRVYIGSFWAQPYQNTENAQLFDAEREDLFKELLALPRGSALRKINELVKRARSVRVHALIISHLKAAMPSLIGKAKKQEELIKNLGREFEKIAQQHQIPPGDFPDLVQFREKLRKCEFSKFAKLNASLIANMKDVLSSDLPKLMKMFPEETAAESAKERSPDGWMVGPQRQARFGEQFDSLEHDADGCVSGVVARVVLTKTGLSKGTLGQIWELADMNKSGALDREEFIVLMYLVEEALNGKAVPATMPADLVPPSKRTDNDSTNPFA